MIDLLSGADVAALLFGSLAILLLMGVPIAHSLGAATLLVIYVQGIPGAMIAQTTFNATDSFPLMAVPFFVLAGYLMEFGGLSSRLVLLARALVGNMAGGFAGVTILACMFFAAMSGSAPATVAAIGSIMIPAMIKHGYSPAYSGAVTATGGSLGIMIPPSTPMIIYGVVGNVSIAQMFIAGAVPGLVTGLALMLISWWMCRQRGYLGTGHSASWRETWDALRDAGWALGAPVVILGGIYGGIFTPTEASIVAVNYGLLVGLFVYRELNWSRISEALQQAVVVGGTVTIIVGLASGFGRLLTQYQIPQQLSAAILSYSDNPIVVMLMLSAGLIVIGTFMESLAMIILLTPILLPLVLTVGFDPIQFGIIMIITSQIGMMTPPLGANLFVAMRIANVTLEQISVSSVPYILTMVAVLVLLVLFPQLSLWLPRLIF